MSESPSKPIVTWLRNVIREKSINTAELARLVEAPRAVVRAVLAGREPLTVDQLVGWTRALELDVKDLMGIAANAEQIAELEAEAPPPALALADNEPLLIDPYGLQAEQALKVAFEIGVNVSFLCDSRQLAESGVPAHVLERQPEHLVIQLDAAFHRHNDPAYSEHGISLSLSFDALCRCTFPWSAISQVILHVEPPEPTESTPEDEEPTGGPHLRLV